MTGEKQRSVPDAVVKCFDSLLLDVAKSGFREEVVPFITAIGSVYFPKNELLVVGRAPYDWAGKGDDPSRFIDAAVREEFCKHTLEPEPESPCLMRWVVEYWGTREKGKYNPAKSAFWRVIKRVAERLAIGDTSDWSCHLAWTNLYRLLNEGGHNPRPRLKRAQERACVEMLIAELQNYLPNRVLLLTGEGWARPFLDAFTTQLGGDITEQSSCDFVECAGRIELGGKSVPIVVGQHPQGSPGSESAKVDEICRLFQAAVRGS
jgi:hypothetical protein